MVGRLPLKTIKLFKNPGNIGQLFAFQNHVIRFFSVMVTFYFMQINHKIIPLKILPFIRNKFMVFWQIFDNFTIITGVIQLYATILRVETSVKENSETIKYCRNSNWFTIHINLKPFPKTHRDENWGIVYHIKYRVWQACLYESYFMSDKLLILNPGNLFFYLFNRMTKEIFLDQLTRDVN